MDGDIGEMLRQVMENPQFGNMLQAVKAQMADGDGTADPAAVMEKLPEMMTVLGPMMQGMLQGTADGRAGADSGGQKEQQDEKEDVQEDGGKGDREREHSAGNSGMFLFKPGSREKRNKLLAALKPYLSPARCAMVDRAMSAMQLGEILGTMTPSGKQEG